MRRDISRPYTRGLRDCGQPTVPGKQQISEQRANARCGAVKSARGVPSALNVWNEDDSRRLCAVHPDSHRKLVGLPLVLLFAQPKPAMLGLFSLNHHVKREDDPTGRTVVPRAHDGREHAVRYLDLPDKDGGAPAVESLQPSPHLYSVVTAVSGVSDLDPCVMGRAGAEGRGRARMDNKKRS